MLPSEILQAVQTGLSGALLLVLNKLWQAYEKQNDRIFTMLEQAEIERSAISKALGYDTQDMRDIVQTVRARRRSGKDRATGQEETH